MFLRISGESRDFAWGSAGDISRLLGRVPSGAREAELWLGAHAGAPSVVLEPQAAGGRTDLAAWIAADPEAALGRGRGARLPFLLKVLAAASTLSLQAHPNREQAIAGFARENALGIPLDAPDRNYRDDEPKPELILALSDTFDALCGFRPASEVRDTIALLLERDAAAATPEPAPLLDWLERMADDTTHRAVFEWLVSRGAGVDELVAVVSRLAEANRDEFELQAQLAEEYPGDPGIVVSLMLNAVTLRRGEALYLPAGNIHAYTRGLGIELMNSSDNVLRGGLTPKHVDVPELLGVLGFSPTPIPVLTGEQLEENVRSYSPAGAGFQLLVATGDARLEPVGPAIALCTAGRFELEGATSSITLERGDSVFVTPEEGALRVTGAGELHLASATEARSHVG